jgi:hypothetical protein
MAENVWSTDPLGWTQHNNDHANCNDLSREDASVGEDIWQAILTPVRSLIRPVTGWRTGWLVSCPRGRAHGESGGDGAALGSMDAMTAATAVCRDLTLVARNASVFDAPDPQLLTPRSAD